MQGHKGSYFLEAKMTSIDYKKFISDTEGINFEDCDVIVKKYESSIANYKNFREYHAAGDEEVASNYLREAGINIYQCCEWALKNYLTKRYHEEFESGSISDSYERALRIELKSERVTMNYLID